MGQLSYGFISEYAKYLLLHPKVQKDVAKCDESSWEQLLHPTVQKAPNFAQIIETR